MSGEAGAASPAADLAALALAAGDLARGCALLATGAGVGHAAPLVTLRRAGNCLTELDHFLARMIVPAARLVGLDAGALARSRSARVRLGWLAARCPPLAITSRRLRAIAALRRIGKGRRGAGHAGRLAREWTLATGLPHRPGEAGLPFAMDDAALAAIAAHYRDCAAALLARLAAARPDLDFSATIAHIGAANVACDGI